MQGEEMHSIDRKTGYIYAIQKCTHRSKNRVYLCNEEMHSIDRKTGYIYAMKKCTQQIVKQGIFMQ